MKSKYTFTFGFIYLMAITSFICGIYLIVTAETTRFWQKTTATVTDITLKEFTQTSSVRNLTPMYTVVPQYSYIIKGKTYHSQVYGMWYALKSRFTTRQTALAWFEKSDYSLGTIIDVYVNPNDFNQAVIIQGGGLATYTPFFLGFFFIFLGINTKSSALKRNNIVLISIYIANVR